MTLAFISVRLPCYVVGLVAVDVWRYDAASTSQPVWEISQIPP